jgi:RNA polymerase sigma-70 factor (ECF subfamily)
VVNLARDKLRARKLQNCDLDEAAATALDTNNPEYDAIFDEQARDLNRAMAQLAYEQREVVLLHLRGGMKFREIAGLQGTSINTAKSRYRYGLQKLRTLLTDEEKKNENR